MAAPTAFVCNVCHVELLRPAMWCPGCGGALEEEPGALEGIRRIFLSAYEDRVGPVGSGEGPAVRGFGLELLRDSDWSRPARHGGVVGELDSSRQLVA